MAGEASAANRNAQDSSWQFQESCTVRKTVSLGDRLFLMCWFVQPKALVTIFWNHHIYNGERHRYDPVTAGSRQQCKTQWKCLDVHNVSGECKQKKTQARFKATLENSIRHKIQNVWVLVGQWSHWCPQTEWLKAQKESWFSLLWNQ